MADVVKPRPTRVLVVVPGPDEGGPAAAAAATLTEAWRARDDDVETLWPLDNKVHASNMFHESALVVYHLGNEPAYNDVYEMAALLPGLAVLHEPVLDRLIKRLLHEGDPNGVRARREARLAQPTLEAAMPGLTEPERTPWAAHIARRSRGVVVPTDDDRDYFRAFGCRTPLFVAPDDAALDEAVASTIALLRDPTREPLARWAASLVDVGADMHTPGQGLGLRYVEAVREFTGGE
jgi:hypothetical protein